MKPTDEQKETIRNVLSELEVYQGEKVVAHEHPLHKAVVQLERLCVERSRSRQRFTLFLPAHRIWCHLLWASRDPDVEKANRKAVELNAVLRKWLVEINVGGHAQETAIEKCRRRNND